MGKVAWMQVVTEAEEAKKSYQKHLCSNNLHLAPFPPPRGLFTPQKACRRACYLGSSPHVLSHQTPFASRSSLTAGPTAHKSQLYKSSQGARNGFHWALTVWRSSGHNANPSNLTVKTKDPGSLSVSGAASRVRGQGRTSSRIPIPSSKQKSLNTLDLLIVDSISLKCKIHPKEGFYNLLTSSFMRKPNTYLLNTSGFNLVYDKLRRLPGCYLCFEFNN